MACKLLIIGACIFFNTRDQNKSFLSLRSAESNRTRVWFSVQVWYLGKAIAYREGRERWFENWKYRIVIFYFLIQIPPQPPPLEICVPRSLTGWKTSTNWFPALTSQCLRLFLLEQEKKKNVWAAWLLSQVSLFIHHCCSQWGSFWCLVWEETGVDFIVSRKLHPGAWTKGHFQEMRKDRSHHIMSHETKSGSVALPDFMDCRSF